MTSAFEPTIGLIMEKDNEIVQLGLTEDQSRLLHAFVASMSKEKELVQLPKEYNLILKSKK